MLTRCAIVMQKRVITPAIFLSAQMLVGCTSSQDPTQPGTDELAGENGQDGETPKADAAHDNFDFVAVEKSGAFDCKNPRTCASYELSRPNRSTIECNDGAYHDELAFEPTEVWLAAKAKGSTDGTFVRVFDRGVRCIAAPCPQYEEGRLNSSREMPIDGVDFADDDSLQDKVYEQTTQPDGVIVVGERTTRGSGRLAEKLRTADQVFFPMSN